MRWFRTSVCLAGFVLVTLQFAFPSHSRADSYNIVALAPDNVQFVGVDDFSHIVFYASSTTCGNPATGCYETFTNGLATGISATVPTYPFDNAVGTCIAPLPSAPCAITKNGRTALIAAEPAGQEGLYEYSGSATPQLLYISGFGATFALNGVGNIVFDDGTRDEWYEAVDLTTATTPEPASILLLATGLLALVAIGRRRLIQQS